MKLRLSTAAVLACLLALAGCGGGHTPSQLKVPAPSHACAGGYVTQYGCSAHSPTFGLPPSQLPKLTRPTSTPTVEQFDAVTLSQIPASAAAVAGYLSGSWPTFSQLAALFPHAIRVPVAIRALPVYPSVAGRIVCLDVEPRDAAPDEAGAWARGELRIGVTPCLYASLRNGMSAVIASLTAAGLQRSQYLLWDADWTNVAHLDPGFDATQWTDHSLGRNLDESTVTLAFLGVTPKPKPKPDPYAIYDKTRRHLPRDVVASEHNTLATWGHAHCLNPVKRAVCKSSRFHMQLLRDRDIFVATHRPPTFRRPAHRYGVNHLGARVKGMQARLHQTR